MNAWEIVAIGACFGAGFELGRFFVLVVLNTMIAMWPDRMRALTKKGG